MMKKLLLAALLSVSFLEIHCLDVPKILVGGLGAYASCYVLNGAYKKRQNVEKWKTIGQKAHWLFRVASGACSLYLGSLCVCHGLLGENKVKN